VLLALQLKAELLNVTDLKIDPNARFNIKVKCSH